MILEQYNRLPQVFKDKIEVDKELSEFNTHSVLDWEKGRNIVLRRKTVRYRCEQFLRKNKRNNFDQLA